MYMITDIYKYDFGMGGRVFEGMMRQFVIGNCDFLMGRAEP